MALKAGRVGVLPSEVDTNGKIKQGGGDIEKVKEQISTFSFRDNEGQPQYKATEDGEWVNFSSGGGMVADLLWTNPSPNNVFSEQNIVFDKSASNYSHLLLALDSRYGRNVITYVIIPKASGSHYVSAMDSSNFYNARVATNISNDGMHFNRGIHGSSNMSINDGYVIPIAVYGINLEL